MIVGSLLLILVAVTLLISGLAGGSSVLLISSIATSLLAAVCLVVGARQAAAVRAAAGGPAPTPLAVDLDADPGPAAGSSYGDGVASENAAFNEPASSDATFGDAPVHDDSMFTETAVLRGTGDLGGATGQGDPSVPDQASSATTQANLDDTDPGNAGNRSDPGGSDRGEPDPDRPDPDWDRVVPGAAAGVPGSFGWPAERDVLTTTTDPARAGTGWAEVDRDTGRYGAGSHPSAPGPVGSDAPFAVHPDPAQAGRDDVLAHLGREDVEEDPADEPAPQRVQPTDAVQVSRMTVDVLVVDGRPRYHLPGCQHLTDRDTEPLPVAEAVDLGFTPCSLCRPVDRLVAGVARR